MIEFVPFRSDHAVRVIIHGTRQVEQWFQTADVYVRAKEKESGDAWTLMQDGAPVACGGFYRYEGPTAEAWFLISPFIAKNRRAMIRFMRWAFDWATDVKKVKTFRAHVLSGDTVGLRWARYWGLLPAGSVEDKTGRRYVVCERTVE